MAGVGGARGEGKKMRTKRSLKHFMKGIVGPPRALEFILSEMWETFGGSRARERHELIEALKGSLLAAIWRDS